VFRPLRAAFPLDRDTASRFKSPQNQERPFALSPGAVPKSKGNGMALRPRALGRWLSANGRSVFLSSAPGGTVE